MAAVNVPEHVLNAAGIHRAPIEQLLRHGTGCALDWEEFRGFAAPVPIPLKNQGRLIASLLKRELLPYGTSLGRPKTPLSHALYHASSSVATVLIQAGAEVNSILSSDQTVPLHDAVRFCPSVVKLLLESGAFPNVPDFLGNLPLHYAARENLSDEMD